MSFSPQHEQQHLKSSFIRRIDVCFHAGDLHNYPTEGRLVVVVDIFRATTTMVTALNEGVRFVKTTAGLEEALALGSENTLTAGERNGEKAAGFDLGNSPTQFLDQQFKGKGLALSTTNGTQAIANSQLAKEIIIGSFLNISVTAEYIRQQKEDVLIVCSGWKNKPCLEDTLYAGALVKQFEETFGFDSDGPLMAKTLYENALPDLGKALSKASHFKRLTRLGVMEDIIWALKQDVYPAVVIQKGDEFVLSRF